MYTLVIFAENLRQTRVFKTWTAPHSHSLCPRGLSALASNRTPRTQLHVRKPILLCGSSDIAPHPLKPMPRYSNSDWSDIVHIRALAEALYFAQPGDDLPNAGPDTLRERALRVESLLRDCTSTLSTHNRNSKLKTSGSCSNVRRAPKIISSKPN